MGIIDSTNNHLPVFVHYDADRDEIKTFKNWDDFFVNCWENKQDTKDFLQVICGVDIDLKGLQKIIEAEKVASDEEANYDWTTHAPIVV